MKFTNKNLLGVLLIILTTLIFSLQDVAVKLLGGTYPPLEILVCLSLIAVPCTVLFYRREGGRGLPATRQPKLEILRGILHFLSFIAYVMGVAAQPLGDIAAIRIATPLVITALSVIFLGEKVGLRRWFAMVIGFIGVFVIIKLGSATFNLGAIFTLTAVLLYSLSTIITRKLKNDSSATMAFYSAAVYLVGSFLVAPLVLAVGPVMGAHPSIAFLLRAWAWPPILHLMVLLGVGVVWASGMYCAARAYSLAQASVVAPFENVVLPINMLWGLLIWKDVPTWIMLAGAGLTLLSGIYCTYQERKEQAARLSKQAALMETDVLWSASILNRN